MVVVLLQANKAAKGPTPQHKHIFKDIFYVATKSGKFSKEVGQLPSVIVATKTTILSQTLISFLTLTKWFLYA